MLGAASGYVDEGRTRQWDSLGDITQVIMDRDGRWLELLEHNLQDPDSSVSATPSNPI